MTKKVATDFLSLKISLIAFDSKNFFLWAISVKIIRNRDYTHSPFSFLHEIHSAYPHFLRGIVIESAGAARLTLHLDQTAIKESLVEMWARQRAGPRESHAGGIRRRIRSGKSHAWTGGVSSPKRRLCRRSWRCYRRRRESTRDRCRDRRRRRHRSGGAYC